MEKYYRISSSTSMYFYLLTYVKGRSKKRPFKKPFNEQACQNQINQTKRTTIKRPKIY